METLLFMFLACVFSKRIDIKYNEIIYNADRRATYI